MESSRLDQLLQFLKENPEDEFILFGLAKEYEKLGQPQEAIKTFEQLLSKNENYTGAYYHLGGIHVKLEEVQKAHVIYKKGMFVCEREKEMHDLSELRGAVEALGME